MKGIDNYQLLKNAIVAQAAKDYRVALVEQHNGSFRHESTLTAIERFFTGPEFAGYTTLDGQALLDEIKQQVIDCDYDLSKIEETYETV